MPVHWIAQRNCVRSSGMTIDLLKSSILESEGFTLHGFTTRKGGVSEGAYESLNFAFDIGDKDAHVVENLNRLKQKIEANLPLARVKQVHSAQITTAVDAQLDEWHHSPTKEADGIIAETNAVIAVQTADCAPVLIACPKTRIVAAIHAGWRGTAKGILRKAVRGMVERGCSASDMIVAIGPCIQYSCYEVGEEVAKALPESADPVPKRPGKYLLDLANAVEVSLIVEGVPSSRIERIGACTHCATDAFFSYRKEGPDTGRMLAFIAGHQTV